MPAGPFVWRYASVQIDGVDLSNRVTSISWTENTELQDDTAHGGPGARSRLPGLTDGSCDITFKQDFSANNVDATLRDLQGSSAFPIVVRPDSTNGIGTNNPSRTVQVLLESFTPFQGAIGELATCTATFRFVGPVAIATA